jgi:nitrogenase molybdenum-iron protein alpha/beta subunit
MVGKPRFLIKTARKCQKPSLFRFLDVSNGLNILHGGSGCAHSCRRHNRKKRLDSSRYFRKSISRPVVADERAG